MKKWLAGLLSLFATLAGCAGPEDPGAGAVAPDLEVASPQSVSGCVCIDYICPGTEDVWGGCRGGHPSLVQALQACQAACEQGCDILPCNPGP